MIALKPASIELSLNASQQIESDRQKAQQHHQQTIDRASHQSELARRRYEEVDPTNRLVAGELERRWESALLEQRQSEESLARFQQKQPSKLTTQETSRIKALSQDIPQLWKAETTDGKDRQIILRALIERITVEVVGTSERMQVTIVWSGGFKSQHELIRAVGKFEKLESADRIRAIVLQLKRRGYCHQAVADSLNEQGYLSTAGTRFTTPVVSQLCRRFRKEGENLDHIGGYENHWTVASLASHLKLPQSTISKWVSRGWVTSKDRLHGQYRILIVDRAELSRLKRLAEYKGTEHQKIPNELKTPAQSH